MMFDDVMTKTSVLDLHSSFKMADKIASHRFFRLYKSFISVNYVRNEMNFQFKTVTTLSASNLSTIGKKSPAQTINPKSIVNNFYQAVLSQYNDKSMQPDLKMEAIAGKNRKSNWKATLQIKWPQSIALEETGKGKLEAQNKVFAKAVDILKEMNFLTSDYKPQLNNREELNKFLETQKTPCFLNLDEGMKMKINNFLLKYSDIEDQIKNICQEEFDIEKKSILDAISGKPYTELSESELEKRNYQLLHHYQWLKSNNTAETLQTNKLPVFNQRNEILSTINQHRVVIISGETGCGKTTQIPQYIFNSYVEKMKGAHCNMIVTQPRRISAINIAERVAEERDEDLGETVGFQVRLSSKIPRQKGSILFCSSGILLNRLQTNPNLEGISHVIIDEAHERDIITDFLLVILRDVIRRYNSQLKLILMSASMNVGKLASYFEQCPVINVPGRIYPVKDYFMGDIQLMNRKYKSGNSKWDDEKNLDLNLVAETIRSIDSQKPPGAILCFLPGWGEIKNVHNRLLEMYPDRSTHAIFPVHSRIPQQDQHRIFGKLPSGVRKIVLATNIAETSITIPDVVYVVNSGRTRETTFDADWGVATLGTRWTSKANMIQRRGRAGRVQPGECYHLYPKELADEFEAFPLPEIQRTSLEKVIIDAKVYCRTKGESAIDFLSRCPDPPAGQAVEQAIKGLQLRRILSDDEELTTLGKCVAKFSCHPYLAKLIVYGSWLRCLDPVLSTAALLTNAKDPHMKTPENKQEIRKLKEELSQKSWSDHIAFSNLFNRWQDESKFDKRSFCDQYILHSKTMEFIKGLKNLFFKETVEFGFTNERSVQEMNSSSNHWPTVTAAFCAGFEPNYVRCLSGEVTRKRIKRESITFKEVYGGRVTITTDSLNHRKKIGTNTPHWLTFFHKTCSSDTRLTVIRDASPAPPLAVLLLSGCRLQKREINNRDIWYQNINIEDPVIVSIDKLRLLSFCCSRSDAELLINLRTAVDTFFSLYLTRKDFSNYFDSQMFGKLDLELLNVLRQLFEFKLY